jgi:CTP:molybdopterin cytidylyltransferase MocA
MLHDDSVLNDAELSEVVGGVLMTKSISPTMFGKRWGQADAGPVAFSSAAAFAQLHKIPGGAEGVKKLVDGGRLSVTEIADVPPKGTIGPVVYQGYEFAFNKG